MNGIRSNKRVFHDEKQRSDGAISPVFGFLMIGLMWFGTFGILSVNENANQAARFLIPTIMALFVLFPGFYLFQWYKIDITTNYVTWKTSIIPSIWVEGWKEPILNYSEIVVMRSKPIYGFGIKYSPSKIAYPIKITGKNISKSAKEFNVKVHAIIVLKHRNNSKKNIALNNFVFANTEMWKATANQLSKDLELPIIVSNS